VPSWGLLLLLLLPLTTSPPALALGMWPLSTITTTAAVAGAPHQHFVLLLPTMPRISSPRLRQGPWDTPRQRFVTLELPATSLRLRVRAAAGAASCSRCQFLGQEEKELVSTRRLRGDPGPQPLRSRPRLFSFLDALLPKTSSRQMGERPHSNRSPQRNLICSSELAAHSLPHLLLLDRSGK
jgi:hypothetical protein